MKALEQVEAHKPDLILLDLMMPDMDGIEVCQRLQASSETRSIPVIFVTARTTKVSKLEGLAVGAVDYITKPIDLDETVARVTTQLRFAAINRENLELQRRLEESRRAATIGAVAQGIAHNLNNLLGVVIGYLDLIKSGYEKPGVVKKNAQHVDDAIQRIVGIIRQLSTLVVKSRPDLTRVALPRLIEGGIRRFHSDYKLTAGVVVYNPVEDLEIDTNIETFEEVLSKVLINAGGNPTSEAVPPRTTSGPARSTPGFSTSPAARRCSSFASTTAEAGSQRTSATRCSNPLWSSKSTVGVGMGPDRGLAIPPQRGRRGHPGLPPKEGWGRAPFLNPPGEGSHVPAQQGTGPARTPSRGGPASQAHVGGIAFLGAGSMASAMVEGLIGKGAYSPGKIACLGGSGASAAALSKRTRIRLAGSP